MAEGGEEEVGHEDAEVEGGRPVEGKLGVDHLKGCVCVWQEVGGAVEGGGGEGVP